LRLGIVLDESLDAHFITSWQVMKTGKDLSEKNLALPILLLFPGDFLRPTEHALEERSRAQRKRGLLGKKSG